MSKSRLYSLIAFLVAIAFAGFALYLGAQGTPEAPRPTQPSQVLNPSPTDPKLLALQFNFCLAQDKVFKLEAPLVTRPLRPSRAQQLLHEAQAIVREQERAFARAGYLTFARLTRTWVGALGNTRARISRGVEPVDAIRPAVRALGAILKRIDCEGDA